jgi:hypothetical protein
MIATFVPLDFCFTHWTEFDGLLFAKLVHQSLFTRSPPAMPIVPTLEADRILAFRAI